MNPSIYIIAGPNGVGKTTFAREFLPAYVNCPIFINADLIAEGLSPLAPDSVAFRAGRLMLNEIKLHVRQDEDFGFESTLAGRSYLTLLRAARKRGFLVHIFVSVGPGRRTCIGQSQVTGFAWRS